MDETGDFERAIAQAVAVIAALNAEQHQEDKAIVAHEAQLQHVANELTRLEQKAEQLARERRQAEEERDGPRTAVRPKRADRSNSSTGISERPTSA